MIKCRVNFVQRINLINDKHLCKTELYKGKMHWTTKIGKKFCEVRQTQLAWYKNRKYLWIGWTIKVLENFGRMHAIRVYIFIKCFHRDWDGVLQLPKQNPPEDLYIQKETHKEHFEVCFLQKQQKKGQGPIKLNSFSWVEMTIAFSLS